jgi:hypothetical protein
VQADPPEDFLSTNIQVNILNVDHDKDSCLECF